MNRGLFAGVFALLILTASVLRCDHLVGRTLWFDEAFSWTLVTRFSPLNIISRTADDVHPPLYYLTLWCWTTFFGTSLISLRLPSVLFGVATAAGSFLVGRDAIEGWREDPTRRYGAQVTGLMSMALVATSAIQVRWSWEARMYTLATLLLIIGTWCILRALDASVERARWWWAGFATASTAMLYTHNYALFSFVGQCLFIVLEFSRRGQRWPLPFQVPGFWSAVIAMAGVAWAYSPWLPVLQAQSAQVQNGYWVPKVDLLTIPRAWYSLVLPLNSVPGVSDQMAIVSGLILVSLVAILAIQRTRLSRLVLALFVTPIVLSYLISMSGTSIIVDRFFLLAHLFAVIGVAGLIGRLAPSSACWCVGALVMSFSLYLVERYHSDLNVEAKPGVRGALKYVLRNRHPDEPILVMHPCIYFSVLYYAGERASPKLYSIPENVTHYTGKPILIPEDYFLQSDLEESSAKRAWVIDTNGFIGHTSMLLPASWKPTEKKMFPDVYYFQRNVTATCWERTDPVPVRAVQNP